MRKTYYALIIMLLATLLCSCSSIKVVSIASPVAERLDYKPEYHFDGYDVSHCLIIFKTDYCSNKLEFASQNDWLYDNSYKDGSIFSHPYNYWHNDIGSNTKGFIYNSTLNFTLMFKL
jgi:hypothetical protein